MPQSGDTIVNPVTGQHLTFLAPDGDTAEEVFRMEGAFAPGGFAGVDHVHPHQHERFEVQEGSAGFRISGRETVLRAGEVVEVPAGTSHTFWNAGEDRMRVVMEFRPALASTARFYELYFAFAHEGRVDREGLPGLLDIATVWNEVSDHAILARPPAWVQHALFRLLRPVARAAGRRQPRSGRAHMAA